MASAIAETVKKQASNPFLWIAVIGGVLTLSESYNQIESNEQYIKTVELRLAKKTAIQQELILDLEAGAHELLMLRKDMDMLSLGFKKDLEMLEVRLSVQEVRK